MPTSTVIEVLKQATKKLIEFEPTPITLTHPPTMIPNGKGGMTSSGSSVTETTPKERFFSQTTPKEVVLVKSEGREIVVDWVLVGPFGDDIREGDTFAVGGVNYKVWNVHDDKRWETKGLVARA